VALRPIAEWDIPEVLIAHQDDPALYRSLGLERPPTGAQLGSEVEAAERDRRAGRRLSLTIVDPDGEDCIGRIVVEPVTGESATARLTIWLVPRRRGRGIGAGALRLAASWLLGDGAFDRLVLDDPAAGADSPLRRAALAAGFRPVAPGHAPGAGSAGVGDDLPAHPGRLELQRREDRAGGR
jgi:RimJ/RimL family protein N-acetyltransferase